MPHKTVIVDNRSTDHSLNLAINTTPDAKFIINKHNYYFCKGNNIGLRHILKKNADYVFVLNNDTEVDANCLELLVTFMQANPNVGACQPLLRFMDRPDIINSAGCCLTFTGKAWDLACGQNPSSIPQEAFRILGATAGAALYRTSTLRDVGLFDEDFVMYFEDVDLSLRIRKANWEIYCIPKANVFHIGSGTISQSTEWRKTYWCERNSFRLLQKHFSKKHTLKALIFGIPFTLTAFASALVRGRFTHAKGIAIAVITGLTSTITHLVRFKSNVTQEKRFWKFIDKNHIYPPKCHFDHTKQQD
jgi:hypothetical protein